METTQYTNHSLNGKVDFIFREGVSCDYHRILLPAMGLGINPHQSTSNPLLEVFCRMPARSLRGNVPVIVDLDDYYYLYPHHYLFNSWNGNKHTETIINALKNADAVTVTNRMLSDKVSQFNDNVFILPNALPFDSGQFNRGDMSGPTRFMWAGGASHLHDLNIIRPVLHSIPFDLTLYGDDGYGEWSKIRNLFGARAKYKKALSVDSYMTGFHGNVMLVPIENNYFNNHKSNLKILEAGCKGMAVIASKCEPYYNKKDAPFIMYAENAQEWALHMKYCSANPNFVTDMGNMLAEHVRLHYNLSDVNEKRKDVYNMLISR